MSISTLHRFLPQIFGIQSMEDTGHQPRKVSRDAPVEQVVIQSYWTAEIQDYEFDLEPLVVAVVETDKWTRGAFLIPNRPEVNYMLNTHQPMYAIDLEGRQDTVAEALHSVDLFQPFFPFRRDLDRYPMLRMSIKVSSHHCVGEFGTRGINPYTHSYSLWKLQYEVIKTILYLVDRYDNEEMRLFTQSYRSKPKENEHE